MGKAFTDDEKSEIKTRLMEAAIELFHDKGAKTLSIREVTKRAGIAQGSFYNFWTDKDALVVDVVKYRAEQKFNAVLPEFKTKLKDPVKFLADKAFDWCIDLKHKTETQSIYRESMKILHRDTPADTNKVAAVYKDTLEEIADWWISHNVAKKVDVQGIINVFAGISVIVSSSAQFDTEYFDQIFRTFIESGIRKYVEA
ncbi:MAG: TetR/AcrR family transcriptional regulator [Spirochaetaceae bacterium]|nr:TetR/AcrR family transcriptional regulator [Spirochaetaceae bacterium]